VLKWAGWNASADSICIASGNGLKHTQDNALFTSMAPAFRPYLGALEKISSI
jgi:hypothetical protein